MLAQWINNKANPWIHPVVSSFTILQYNTLALCQNNKATIWFEPTLCLPHKITTKLSLLRTKPAEDQIQTSHSVIKDGYTHLATATRSGFDSQPFTIHNIPRTWLHSPWFQVSIQHTCPVTNSMCLPHRKQKATWLHYLWSHLYRTQTEFTTPIYPTVYHTEYKQIPSNFLKQTDLLATWTKQITFAIKYVYIIMTKFSSPYRPTLTINSMLYIFMHTRNQDLIP